MPNIIDVRCDQPGAMRMRRRGNHQIEAACRGLASSTLSRCCESPDALHQRSRGSLRPATPKPRRSASHSASVALSKREPMRSQDARQSALSGTICATGRPPAHQDRREAARSCAGSSADSASHRRRSRPLLQRTGLRRCSAAQRVLRRDPLQRPTLFAETRATGSRT